MTRARRHVIAGHGTGLLPDLPDFRDLRYRVERGRELAATIRLDEDPAMPTPYDQGQLGSCTANGIAGAIEFQLGVQGRAEWRPSRLFIYYLEREIEGTVDQDAGAMIRDGIKSVATTGAPPETAWRYSISKFATKPSAKAYAEAAQGLVSKYERVAVSNAAFRSVLNERRPVVFGVSLYESFESVGADGMVPMPSAQGEDQIGGHCMCIVGYQMINGALFYRVRNSWGTRWADHGYCWMPAAYLSNRSLVSDCWAVDTLAA